MIVLNDKEKNIIRENVYIADMDSDQAGKIISIYGCFYRGRCTLKEFKEVVQSATHKTSEEEEKMRSRIISALLLAIIITGIFWMLDVWGFI